MGTDRLDDSAPVDGTPLPERGFCAVHPLLLTAAGIDRLGRAAHARQQQRDLILAAALIELDRVLDMKQERDGLQSLHFPQGRITDALLTTEVALPALAWISLGKLQCRSGLAREEIVQLAIDERLAEF